MRFRSPLLLAALLAPLPLAAQSFTLPQVLGYPFPLELVAAPSGGAVAWVFAERGVRNVYAAQAPDWTARRITRYAADDGQEITQLAFTPDGKGVVYVRGGDHDGNWEAPAPVNPALSAVAPVTAIWLVRTAGDSAPRMLAEGDAPAVSPAGDRVAFIRGGQAWSVPLAKGEAKQLFFARGTTSGLRWSPDGRMLAFVSDRGDHAFIGVFTSDSMPVRFLDPAADNDFEPRWSPDGKRVAFLRMPGQGGPPPSWIDETPVPWAIRVADVATGASHEVWRSPATLRGNLPQVAGDANLAWGAGDRIVFVAELDGWPHLYTVPAGGGAPPTLLTPGNFMVEHVAVSPDHASVIFSANGGPDANDDDRRHIFRVAVEKPGAAILTPGDGVEWTPVVTGDGAAVAFLSATTARPPLPAVLALGAKGAPKLIGADRIPADWPGAQFVVPRNVTFTAPDGTLVHGQLFARANGAGKAPGVVFVHGGPPRQMMLGWHYMDYYSNAYAVNQYLASRGFVVLAVNYRLGIGYGHDFQHAPHTGPSGAAEYQDVLAAGRFLAAQPGVDPKRVGIWGGSYGGFLGAMALARNSDVFAAGVDLHGVHDWVADARDYYVLPGWRMERGDLDSAKALAWKSSPVADIATWRSPVLLIQGDDDHNVRFSQTVDLARRLATAGVPYEVLVFPDDIHDFLLYRNWLTADSATAEFLSRTIGKR